MREEKFVLLLLPRTPGTDWKYGAEKQTELLFPENMEGRGQRNAGLRHGHGALLIYINRRFAGHIGLLLWALARVMVLESL